MHVHVDTTDYFLDVVLDTQEMEDVHNSQSTTAMYAIMSIVLVGMCSKFGIPLVDDEMRN